MNKHTQRSSSANLAVVAWMAGVLLASAGMSGCANDVGDGGEVAEAPAGEVGASDDKAIVGGSAVSIGAHPWQVSVQSGGWHFCGGSILSAEWILTAQHCVEGVSASGVRVLAGATKLSQASSGQNRAVAQIVRVSGYTSPENGKDVALLRLATPLSFSSQVQPIDLVTADDVGATNAGV